MVTEKITDLETYKKAKEGKLDKFQCRDLSMKYFKQASELEFDLQKVRIQIRKLIEENRSKAQEHGILKAQATYFMLLMDDKNKAEKYKSMLSDKIVPAGLQ